MNAALSIGGYLLMVLGLLGLMAMRSLFSESPVVILVQAAAVILLISARIAFGCRSFHAAANPTEGGLVTSGPYRYIRHPIYTSVFLFVLAGVSAHLQPRTILLVLLILAGAVLRIFLEEKMVPLRYPEYKAYAARTWRMVPFIF